MERLAQVRRRGVVLWGNSRCVVVMYVHHSKAVKSREPKKTYARMDAYSFRP